MTLCEDYAGFFLSIHRVISKIIFLKILLNLNPEGFAPYSVRFLESPRFSSVEYVDIH